MSAQIEGRYFGESKPLFMLYMKTALLTLVTLGIYRFWAKTRLRKYVWSAVSGDDDSFEYTGTGLEKFLGFLVAIVILAIYLGFVQMILFYFGLNLMNEPTSEAEVLAQLAAVYITFFAVLPLLLFAQYRARRYKLARSRWRGLRFGMDNGAWGFAWRGLGYYLLVIVTLGILTPMATYRLEKYMADRSWYGDAKFQQNGRWQALFKGMKHILFGLLLMVGLPIVFGLLNLGPLAAISLFVGYFWFLFGMIYYRVFAFNYLTNNKVLDGEVTFDADAQIGRIATIAIIGTIVVGVVFAVILAVAAGIGYSSFQGVVTGGGVGAASFPFLSTAVIVVLYVVALMIAGGLSLVMITQPIIDHVVTHLTVQNADHLATIQQRAADSGADAEGFADALDVGGAL